MLTTIKKYCADRGVSKQFVYEYIRKEKIRVLELPVYADYQGKRIEAGMQKFIEPLVSTLELTDVERAALLASQSSDLPGVRADLEKLILAEAEQLQALQSALEGYYAHRPPAEQEAYRTAQDRLRKLLLAETMELKSAVNQLMEEVNAE